MSANYNPDSVNAVLSRMETKLDQINTTLTEAKQEDAALKKRIAALENFKYYLLGLSAFVIVGIEWVKDIFPKFKN